MLNRLNTFLCICNKENVSKNIINKKRNEFIALICDDVVLPSHMSTGKIKNTLNKNFTKETHYSEDNDKSDILENLQYSINIFHEMNITNDFLNERKEIISKNILSHALGKNVVNKELVKERILKGLCDIAFSENNPLLLKKILENQNNNNCVFKMGDLFKKLNSIKRINCIKINEWMDILKYLPQRKDLFKDVEHLANFINMFRILIINEVVNDLNPKLIGEPIFTSLYKDTLKIIQKENYDLFELNKLVLNKIFAGTSFLNESQVIMAKELLLITPDDLSAKDIHINFYGKNLMDTLRYFCDTPNMFIDRVKNEYEKLFALCIEREKNKILNNLSNNKDSHIYYKSKRL